MKTWKTAEIVAIDIEETAGGRVDSDFEGYGVVFVGILPVGIVTTNDSLATPSGSDIPSEQPGTLPSTPGTGTNDRS